VEELEEHIEKLKGTSHDFSEHNAERLTSAHEQIDALTQRNDELREANDALEREVGRLSEDLQVLRTVKKSRGVDLPAPRTPQTPAAAGAEGPGESEPAEVSLTLDLDFNEVGPEGSQQRQQFERDLVHDLAHAAGTPPALFLVKRLSPGSVHVDLEIAPDSSSAVAPAAIAAELQRQASDAGSKLRAGKITSHTSALQALPPRARGPGAPMGGAAAGVMVQTQARGAPPKTHAAPPLRLSASAPGVVGGGGREVEAGEVEELVEENQKLLGDNKR